MHFIETVKDQTDHSENVCELLLLCHYLQIKIQRIKRKTKSTYYKAQGLYRLMCWELRGNPSCSVDQTTEAGGHFNFICTGGGGGTGSEN